MSTRANNICEHNNCKCRQLSTCPFSDANTRIDNRRTHSRAANQHDSPAMKSQCWALPLTEKIPVDTEKPSSYLYRLIETHAQAGRTDRTTKKP
jgi:hypothetical protein